MNHPVMLPDIQIEPAEYSGRVTLTCLPSTGDPVVIGVRLEIAEYPADDGRLSGVRTAHSSGPILCAGRELIEVRWLEKLDGKLQRERTHWIDPRDEDGSIRLVMREIRTPEGEGTIEDVDCRFPFTIQSGDTWVATDRFLRGDRMAEASYRQTVGNACRVTIGDRSEICLRIAAVPLDPSETRQAEQFIECETGQMVCSRSMAVAERANLLPDGLVWRIVCRV